METIVEVKDLTWAPLFYHFSFSLEKQTLTVLSGSNMCGKTTLIKILAGIIRTKQSVFYELCPLEVMTTFDKQQQISVLFANQDMSIYYDRLLKIKDSILDTSFNKGVEHFNLSLLLRKKDKSYFHFLRLFFALCYFEKPTVLLLDTPFLKVSEEEKKVLFADLAFLKEQGLTILITSTNLEDSLYADRLVILNQGSLLLDGKPLEVLKEDSLLNKIGLQLPFFVDLSIKLQYYNLIDKIYLNQEQLVNALWKFD